MAREGGRVGRGRAIQAKSSHETQTKKIQDKFEEVIFVDLGGLRAELENILCCFRVLLGGKEKVFGHRCFIENL